jgi:hypothetical protein
LVATNKQTNKQTRDWLHLCQLQKQEEEEQEGEKKEGSFLTFFIKISMYTNNIDEMYLLKLTLAI